VYSPLRYAGHIFWKRRPVQLTFFVTRRCNAGCPFCFYRRKGDAQPLSEPELALDEVERLAPFVGRLLWLAFSGGEPFMREDIVDISRIFYRHAKPSIMLISTNGLMPEAIAERTEEILRDCPRTTVVVKLSLDGVGEAHDVLRGSPGSFDKVMRTYGLLGELTGKYSNFELGMNTVFCPENENEMEEIFDFTRGLKRLRTHTLSLVRGEVRDSGPKALDLNKYREAAGRLEADIRGRSQTGYRFFGAGLKSAQDILQRRYIYETISAGKRLIPCYAGALNLVLTETGEVYPCEMLSRRMGSVRDYDYDMRALVRSDEARSAVGRIRATECHCSHECYFMTNILFNPRLYPALLRESLKLESQ